MKNPCRVIVGCVFSFTLALSGCSTGEHAAPSGGRDHAYIVYWPPADNTRTRVAVKDLIDMKGVVTTAGSQFFSKNNPPAARDAECLRGLRSRNAQIVGKANLTEFAMGVSGINDYFGTPRNPQGHHRKWIPGGSSSGSAVAVADGTADVAIGTDTAGSIRVPAACCGIVGLKTTFGLISLEGVHPVSPHHLDTVGPMAKDVAHTVEGMDLLEGGFAGQYRRAKAAKPSAGMIRVGRLYVGGTASKVDQAVDDALARTGFKVVALDKTFQDQWNQAERDGNTIAAAGAWLSDGKYQNKFGVSLRTKATMLLGAVEYHLNYRAALHRQAAWQAVLRHTFEKVDLIALPTLRTMPPTIPLFGGAPTFEAFVLTEQNTVPVNFAGNPAVALPIPYEAKPGKFTSLELIGPRLSEAALLNAGRLVEARQPVN